MNELFAWLRVYIPFDLLDPGLLVLLALWVAALAGGFTIWLLQKKRARSES
jgi:hypothetical protein